MTSKRAGSKGNQGGRGVRLSVESRTSREVVQCDSRKEDYTVMTASIIEVSERRYFRKTFTIGEGMVLLSRTNLRRHSGFNFLAFGKDPRYVLLYTIALPWSTSYALILNATQSACCNFSCFFQISESSENWSLSSIPFQIQQDHLQAPVQQSINSRSNMIHSSCSSSGLLDRASNQSSRPFVL